MAHDALDWFAAIGPTLAAGAAAWATWKTAQVAKQVGGDSLAFRRRMSRPRVIIGKLISWDRGGIGLHVKTEIKNTGQSTAEITSVQIRVEDELVVPTPMEGTLDFWRRVIRMVVPGVKIVAISGQVIRPPFALSAEEQYPLLDVRAEGDMEVLFQAFQGIEVAVHSRAPWDELFATRDCVGGRKRQDEGMEMPPATQQ
jgi:hypothetical protein